MLIRTPAARRHRDRLHAIRKARKAARQERRLIANNSAS